MTTKRAERLDSGEQAANSPQPPRRLGIVGWLRWGWRRLTRMSTALVLLAILALAAIPGGVLPQSSRDPAAVASYRAAHPALAPWLERAGLFNVFASPWFVAVYLLLFISLIGCIWPRLGKYARELRAPLPQVPKNLARLEEHRELDAEANPDEASAAIVHAAGRRAVRVEDGEITVVRGRIREAGNLVFHIGLLATLIALVAGQAFQHSGQIVIVEGKTAANAPVDYDTFNAGLLFDTARLEPFTVRLDSLTTQFAAGGRPDFFEAAVTLVDRGEERAQTIRVNAPAIVAGTGIYLMGNGYAPVVTVTGADGHVAFAGPVPFLVKDPMYTSDGVIKVPDLGPTQLGLQGQLYPAAVSTPSGIASAGPLATNPRLVLQAYKGDLGLDSGIPQNVYRLDTAKLTKAGGLLELGVGDQVELPDGLGTLRFDGVKKYAAFDLTANPGASWLLAAVLIATAGLIVSLFTARRRVFIRITPTSGGCHIEAAGSVEGSDAGLGREIDRLLEPLS